MLQPMFIVILRLFGLTIAGYLLFRIPIVRRHLLSPFVFIVLNVLFPLYFIDSFTAGWHAALSVGWIWMFVFFFACAIMLTVQTLVGHALVNRVRGFQSDQPRHFVVLFGVQNVGYIPLPILQVLAPPSLMVYMFFFILAYNILFWTFAVSYLSGESRAKFQFNMPIAGIVIGLLLAMSNLYHFVPHALQVTVHYAGLASINLILVVLGGILATIPRADLRFRPEFGRLILWRMLVYPAAILGILAIVPFTAIRPDLVFGLRLAIVLEAAVPPATNIMIVSRVYGTEQHVHYAGSGIILTYVASLLTLPLFMFLTTLL